MLPLDIMKMQTSGVKGRNYEVLPNTGTSYCATE